MLSRTWGHCRCLQLKAVELLLRICVTRIFKYKAYQEDPEAHAELRLLMLARC